MRRSASLSVVGLLLSVIISVPVIQLKAATIKGSDVLIIGDSFFAMSGEIKKFLDQHARDEGVIGQNESFRSGAVSGAILSQISTQYSNSNPKPKWVIMDAGGNDCLMGSCSNPPTIECAGLKTALNGVQPLLDKMKNDGVQKVLWMRYPEPQGGMAGSLKPKLDALMPEVEKVCKASTNPPVLWVDLRPVWGTNASYTTDGIHPTTAGSQATADAFWDAIKKNNFFGSTDVQKQNIEKPIKSLCLSKVVSADRIQLSMYLNQPSRITVQITTISGRTILKVEKQESSAGYQTVRFPLGAITPGVYCLEIQNGQLTERSTMFLK